MKRVTLIIHLESAEAQMVWWADSPDVAGFTAAGDTLAELRERATAALHDQLGTGVEIIEELGGDNVETHSREDGADVQVVRAELIPG